MHGCHWPVLGPFGRSKHGELLGISYSAPAKLHAHTVMPVLAVHDRVPLELADDALHLHRASLL